MDCCIVSSSLRRVHMPPIPPCACIFLVIYRRRVVKNRAPGSQREPIAYRGRDRLGLLERRQMPAFLDDDEPSTANRRRHLLVQRDRRQRVLPAAEDQGRASDAFEVGAPVGPAHDRGLLAHEAVMTDAFGHADDRIDQLLVGEMVLVDEERQKARRRPLEMADPGQLDEAMTARPLLLGIGLRGGIEQREADDPMRCLTHDLLGDIAAHRQAGQREVFGHFTKHRSGHAGDRIVTREIAHDGCRDIGQGGNLRLEKRAVAEQPGEQKEGRAGGRHGHDPSRFVAGRSASLGFAPSCHAGNGHDFQRKDLTFDCTDPINRHRKFPRFFDGNRFHSMNFTDLALSPEVLQAVSDTGYTTPTPIPAQAIPVILTGRDVLRCAQPGTGNTAGFTLPMIDILAAGRAKARMPRSLILEPTRELAAQVSNSFETYGKHHKLNMALLVGGEGFTDQVRKLERGVDVLIATPGRLLDLIERGKILLSDCKILVIDEADRMLDMGFIPDVERIAGFLPKLRQTLFFSATTPPEIRRLADAFLSNPKEIAVAPPASPALLVEQALVVVDGEEKREVLRRLIRSEEGPNALIFCNRKKDVDILQKSLARHGFDVAALHGDMSQPKRTETLERFKKDEIRLLVCSDVAARGLDIQGLSHVFNFDVPIHAEDYVHRIGRTGRAGMKGRAFTIAATEDGRFVAAIVALIGKDLPPVEVDGIATQALVYDDVRRGRRGRGTPVRS